MAANTFQRILSFLIDQCPIRAGMTSCPPKLYLFLMASLASADPDKRGLAGRGGGSLSVGKFIVVVTIDFTAEFIERFLDVRIGQYLVADGDCLNLEVARFGGLCRLQ